MSRLSSLRPTREFYIPAGAVRVADKASDAVAYLYEREGRPFAMAFHGRAAKPTWHFRFTSPASREKRIAEHFERVRAWYAARAARAEKRRAPHNLQVGHILVASWGYEQTNIDWYEVTAVVGPHTVEIRKVRPTTVRETGWLTGKSVPSPGDYVGEPMRRRASADRGVRINDVATAYLWDGRPRSWSAYA